ncbi:MAG: hypothetical protein LBI82_05925 [Dysgonamonadaceae bacterium]|jgi:hypothetical protein|nr:hypothetical protein [Dysgonamonadaceae bacterium]
MEHVFTSNDCKKINVIKKNEKSDLYAPSKRSLTLIMQFAAAYHVEKDLSLSSLSGIILN